MDRFSSVWKSALGDGAGGAAIGAAAAVDASTSVDDELGVALGDSAHGAAIGASAASHAAIVDHICHLETPPHFRINLTVSRCIKLYHIF